MSAGKLDSAPESTPLLERSTSISSTFSFYFPDDHLLFPAPSPSPLGLPESRINPFSSQWFDAESQSYTPQSPMAETQTETALTSIAPDVSAVATPIKKSSRGRIIKPSQKLQQALTDADAEANAIDRLSIKRQKTGERSVG